MLQFRRENRGEPKPMRERSAVSASPSNADLKHHALDRVVVVGTSGSGKSTLARKLAERLASPYVELDAIQWLPGWIEQEPTRFRAQVDEATSGPRWVVDGNYTHVSDLVWNRASAILWLDFSFPLVFARAVRRTLSRVARREVIFGGNRETLGKALSRDGIPWWVIRSYRRRRRDFSRQFASGRFAEAQVVVFRHPRQLERFLAELPAGIVT
jgi:adenylate kinase family enzyme